MYDLYNMFFKRKSFRRFDDTLTLSSEELQNIEQQLDKAVPLLHDIKIEYRIVRREETTCRRGQYCLLVYSEKKENYLLNVGYILEQMDLWMASQNIGACWYGMGRPDKLMYNGLDYVIMLAFGKSRAEEFRKDYTKAKRKEIEKIWSGDYMPDVTDVVRFAPSACNSQPWRVVCENKRIMIFRSTKVLSIIPKARLSFYNSIDMGIFLCFLEIALRHNEYEFKRVLYENEKPDAGQIKIGEYTIS